MRFNPPPQKDPQPRAAKRRMNVFKSLALLAILGSTPAFAQYGDTMTINGLSGVPAGWVVTNISYRAIAFYGTPDRDTILENQTLTIKDLVGAPFGARETILQSNAIPAGWVILERSRPVFNQPSHNPTYLIQNLNR